MLLWAADMLAHACQRALWALGERGNVATLRETARHLLAEHEEIWRARNRPGGLADSQARLEKAAQDYA